MRTGVFRVVAGCALLMLGATGAHAQRAYVGASGGVSSWGVDCSGTTSCDRSGSAFRVAAGYNFIDIADRARLGAEVFYLDVGKTSASVSGIRTTIDGSGFGLALTASGRFVPSSRFGYLVRIGAANMQSDLAISNNLRNLPTSKSSVRGLVGVGASFHVTPNFSVRAELDVTSVKWPDDQVSGVVTAMGGIAFHF